MPTAIRKRIATGQPDLCTVVVIYDDNASRALALRACDQLLRQNWENVEIDFHWWRTDFLRDLHMGAVAARHAIASDIVIVCSHESNAISPTLEAWFESWIERRKDHDGVLIDLDAPKPSARRHTLQEIARRGRFDYLTAAPDQSASDSTRPVQTPSPRRDGPTNHTRIPPRPK